MNKMLIVCGPTATGKTKLSLHLAKKYNGEIISADSRQVYKNLNIGTGKDIPMGATKEIKKNFFGSKDNAIVYEIEGVPVWGYDLVETDEEFSVSNYLRKVEIILDDILKRGKLPILTGGTGLYIKAVVDGFETINIPRNDSLRKIFSDATKEELYEKLATLDPVRAANLNCSDMKNPARLIRAIEVAMWKIDNKVDIVKRPNIFDTLFLGLSLSDAVLKKNIETRTKKMYEEGIVEEIESLLNNGITWENQALNTIGYIEWKDYINKKNIKVSSVLDSWITNQRSYAKRQMTWFKKEKRINWFDVKKKGYIKNIEKLIDKWYTAEDTND